MRVMTAGTRGAVGGLAAPAAAELGPNTRPPIPARPNMSRPFTISGPPMLLPSRTSLPRPPTGPPQARWLKWVGCCLALTAALTLEGCAGHRIAPGASKVPGTPSPSSTNVWPTGTSLAGALGHGTTIMAPTRGSGTRSFALTSQTGLIVLAIFCRGASPVRVTFSPSGSPFDPPTCAGNHPLWGVYTPVGKAAQRFTVTVSTAPATAWEVFVAEQMPTSPTS